MSDESRRIIERLALAPHPEGGWYREVHRSSVRVHTPTGARPALTTIYYLLERGEVGRWHVVDADEVWHFYAGAPLELLAYEPHTRKLTRQELGSPAGAHEAVGVIGAGIWQAARSLGAYSLVGCSVGPGFEYRGFQFVSSLPDHEHHFAGPLKALADLL